MIFIMTILGAIVGGAFFGGFFGGVINGALLGLLAGWLFKQNQLLDALRRELAALGEISTESAEPARPEETQQEPVIPPAPVEPEPVSETEEEIRLEVPVEQVDTVEPFEPAPEIEQQETISPAERAVRAAEVPIETWSERDVSSIIVHSIKRWFTTGNVPVKVGMIISLFGVSFLVKEGVDRGWLVFPIELRLVLVALFGIVLLVIGWRLRDKRRVYALTVQGGGIAIIYLTIFSAFRLFSLLPPLPAFVMLVIVTVAVGALAVLQDSMTLALLGIVGGFAAPILVSTGEGNHIVLFSYYAVLNLAVFGISWFKAWRVLNVLGFLFTFVVGTVWGYLAYNPDRFATTEPFLILFVLMYITIPVLFARQQATGFQGYVDGTLVFGTPLIGFGLQSQLVANTEYGLAISAIVLAALYVSIATYLFRQKDPQLRVLTESFLGLSVVFLAIAIPLALDARWTSVAWALQGAGMVWIGKRQGRILALGAGILLQLGAAAAYLLQPFTDPADIAFINGYYLGAMLLAIAGWFSSWVFDRVMPENARRQDPTLMWVLFIWGTYWWLDAGIREIDRFLPDRLTLHISLIFVAGTVWAAVIAARRLKWPRFDSIGLVMIAAIGIAAMLDWISQPHPLANYGWLAWPAAFATHFGFLRLRESSFDSIKTGLHALGYWILASIIASETHWWLDQWTAGVWPVAGTLAVISLFVLVTMKARTLLAWPVGEHWRIYHDVCAGLVLLLLVFVTLVLNYLSPGDPTPLIYIPLLNPLELASVFVFLVAFAWYSVTRERIATPALGDYDLVLAGMVLGIFLLTMTVARSVHHWGQVPFDLTSLAESNVLQASLSIVWGITSLACMVLGARRTNRLVWMAGAILMAIVVGKLFIVELGNTGTITRIISFLGVGIFLLIVGYLAPVPPRRKDQVTST